MLQYIGEMIMGHSHIHNSGGHHKENKKYPDSVQERKTKNKENEIWSRF